MLDEQYNKVDPIVSIPDHDETKRLKIAIRN